MYEILNPADLRCPLGFVGQGSLYQLPTGQAAMHLPQQRALPSYLV